MNKEFIPYEQALELKELGFLQDDTTCRCIQNEGFEEEKLGWGILYQQAFRWFRDRYGYSYSIGRTNICVYHLMVQGTLLTNMIQDCKSYEEAELKCIQAFIDAAKQNRND